MLTFQQLKIMVPGTIIAKGTVKNSPDGVYMTSNNPDRDLLWVARAGGGEDWAIYIGWADGGETYVLTHGDKVKEEKNIKKLVPCDDEAFKRYRY